MNEAGIRANLLAHIHKQIPAGIRDLFQIKVETDAYLIRPKAIFVGPDGREYKCELEPGDIFGRLRTEVPEVFIARLCTVV